VGWDHRGPVAEGGLTDSIVLATQKPR
jgi:hypothetical protein